MPCTGPPRGQNRDKDPFACLFQLRKKPIGDGAHSTARADQTDLLTERGQKRSRSLLGRRQQINLFSIWLQSDLYAGSHICGRS
eukprot:3205495-Rhodomonas_salina.1